MIRNQELGRIEGIVTAARVGRSGGLLIIGEPGAGKSWLCRRAIERAAGFRVITAHGVRSESKLGYAGLFDILAPLLDGQLEGLAPPRAHALRVALRLEESAVVDRLAVGFACLDLLAAAAEAQPLLIVVDDAHWVDDASLNAVRFAARRLNAERVGFLFAVRPEGEAAFAHSNFEPLTIGGPPEVNAIGLLNAATSSPLNVSRSVHPLTQAAAWQGAELAARHSAHRAIARQENAAGIRERAAWHLADTAAGPDAVASLALGDVALAARARGAPHEAARAWRRAAELARDPTETLRLGFEEARDLARAGRAPAVLDHVARMLDAQPPAPMRADLELLRGNVLMWMGRLDEAASVFDSAAADVRSSDPGRAAALLCAAAFARATCGDIGGASVRAKAASGLAEEVGGAPMAAAQVTLAWAMILRGEARRGYPLLLRSSDPGPPGLLGSDAGVRFGQLACWMEDYGRARHELEAAIVLARVEGCATDLPHALGALSELEFRHAEWTAARRLAEEAVRFASDLGQDFHVARVQLAQLDAVMGYADGVRAHVDAILDAARRTGSRSLEIYAWASLGLFELGRDDPIRAINHLEHVQVLVQAMGLREPNVVQWRADLIESQSRAGRAADAARTLETLEREAHATGRRWALAAAARCRALLAPADEIDGAFAKAHQFVAGGPSSFERARTELCWGERLRREHRRVEARYHLDEALRRFEALGAAPWAEKAARELSASGDHARRGSNEPSHALTAAERQIAALVAEGRTNKDIAASLFLSPKTIEFHLGRIYRKLDIHRRTQLARAMLLDPSSTQAGGLAIDEAQTARAMNRFDETRA